MTSSLSPAPTRDLEDLHILVVDDNPDTRELLAIVLMEAGARVTTAASALEAREVAAGEAFDVLLSDVSMPRHGGCELIGWLRAAGMAGLVAVGISGHSSQRDREAALAAGFDAYVTKPITPDALVAHLGEALAQRPGPRAATR